MSARHVLVPRLLHSLESSAREIDQTFAVAGRELGDGLTLFEALKDRLSSLSGELSGGDMAQAGTALAGLAGQLRDLDGGLSHETATLEALATHSRAASEVLERLLDHMRLITILARSARIEAVAVHSSENDFNNFTTEISVLTSNAQRAIQVSARDHDKLNALLLAALTAQRAFHGSYGRVLSALADKLDQTLAEVDARQRRSIVLTSDAAAHSGKIAMAAGGAIIALQSGDSIRQRLEHAIAGLNLAGALGSDDLGLGDRGRRLAVAILHELQAAQLHASAEALGNDADSIESTLALLAVDTAGLIDLVAALYRGDGGKAASFLQKLEAELEEASDLLGKCDRARAEVDHVTSMLAGVLEACQDTVSALSGTVSSIVLIGMNAGLRAARLGDGGRSLVIIAQELKAAADWVARDAARLTPVFEQMQIAASRLKDENRLDGDHFGQLDATMQQSLEVMRQTGERLAATLDKLTRDGSGFGSVIAQARLSFSNAGAMSDVIAAAADQLAGLASTDVTPDALEAASVSQLLQQRIWPNYTMAAERTIHSAIVAEAGLDSAKGEMTFELSAQSDAVDDFLF